MPTLKPETVRKRRLEAEREMRKLRELVHFLLAGERCWVCQQPLSPTADSWVEHGNGWGPQFTDQVTVHHLDGVHANNTHDNKVLCHRACHKSWHLTQRWLANEFTR